MTALENPVTVVGVFQDRPTAERAIADLHRAGFSDDEIGFAVRQSDDRPAAPQPESVTGSRAGEGAMGGMLAGAGIGGLIAAGAAMLIPGFGPVVAGGILATVLGGAAVGAAAGGVLGALAAMGVPNEEATFYESELSEGRVLVIVKTVGRYLEAREILRRAGAYDIDDRTGRRAVA